MCPLFEWIASNVLENIFQTVKCSHIEVGYLLTNEKVCDQSKNFLVIEGLIVKFR